MTNTTTSAPTVTKRVEYSRDDHDYRAVVCFEDGTEEYIGSRTTHHDASLLASDYIIQFYSDSHTPEKAAQLIHEELAQEGRHAELAEQMGGGWVAGECWEEAGAPTQEELRLEAIAKEAPEGCTACNDAGCPCCDTELASETPPPHTWITHTGRTRTERYPAESAVMVEPEPPVDDGPADNWGGFRSDIPIEPPPPRDGETCHNCYPGHPCYDHEPTWAKRWIAPPTDQDAFTAAEFYAQAQPAPTCGACGGPHHIQRCPEIRTLLMPGPLPTPHKCPSCGDARARPGLCAACREAGEAIEMERRFEFSALPAEWSF